MMQYCSIFDPKERGCNKYQISKKISEFQNRVHALSKGLFNVLENPRHVIVDWTGEAQAQVNVHL